MASLAQFQTDVANQVKNAMNYKKTIQYVLDNDNI